MAELAPYITVKKAMAADELSCWQADIYGWLRDGTLNGDLIGTGRIIYTDEKYESLKIKRQGPKT